MSKQTRFIVPQVQSAAMKVSQWLMTENSIPLASLRERLGYPERQGDKVTDMLDTWIARGWFDVEIGGSVGLTQRSRKYLAGIEEEVYVGIPAEPRDINVYDRPAYVPPKVYRREQPEYAKRPEGFGFITIGLREVAA